MGVSSYDPPSDVVLRHYGVKGMRWGVIRKNPRERIAERRAERKANKGAVKSREGHRISVNEKTGEYQTSKGTPVSADAVVARARQVKAKNQGSDSLSTKELQELVNRMNLEKQYDGLNPTTMNKGLELTMKFAQVAVPVIAMSKISDVRKSNAEDMDPKMAIGLAVAEAVVSKMISGGGKKKKDK